MTFSGVATLGAAVALVAVAAAAAAPPAAAAGVVWSPTLHATFRQASAIPPELLAGKQPPGFFPPGSEPTPVPQQGPSPTPTPTPTPTASAAPTPTASAAPTPTSSAGPTPTTSAGPTPTTSAGPTPTTSAGPTPTTSVAPTPTVSASPAPSATTSPAAPGGALTPTADRLRVRRSHGKLTARVSNAECTLLTYDGYRPRLINRRNVVHTDAAGKRIAVVSVFRRVQCVIQQGDPSKGTPTGVVFGGKVYGSLGASGEGGWCEAGEALVKDALWATHQPSSRRVTGGIRVSVYTQGEARCELVAGTRKPRREDD